MHSVILNMKPQTDAYILAQYVGPVLQSQWNFDVVIVINL